MVYVTGDTHGVKARFRRMVWDYKLTQDDKLIIAGDAGLVYRDNIEERLFRQEIAEELPFQILYCDGNHENFDVLNNDFPVEELYGGRVHIIQRNRKGEPKIIHLMRGEIYTIEGHTYFVFGGAISRDRIYRTPHKTWWEEEMPTQSEMDYAVENLKKFNNTIDFVITHTVPESIMSFSYPCHEEEMPLNQFLQRVRENITYGHWYCGHLHIEREFENGITCNYFNVRNVIDNSIIGEENEEE
ncbi:MAG: metallophosphoesterase [Lachnospiraceae bacterium]|nr:metallophosphoesterase [Lachnospiraceae bacterium]